MQLTYKLRLRDRHASELNRQARAVKTYSTGQPCKRGHIAERRIDNRSCVECVREDNAKRRKKNAISHNAANREWYARNKDHRAAYAKRWRANNPEKAASLRRNYYLDNRASETARRALRRARLRNATPPWADLNAIRAVYEEAAHLSRETGVPHDVDHIEPLYGRDRCGLHVHWNLRPLPASVNRGKGNNPNRMWQCDCGAIHDRDVNAARNILAIGLDSLVGGAHV